MAKKGKHKKGESADDYIFKTSQDITGHYNIFSSFNLFER
jgi:hypothetical protein